MEIIALKLDVIIQMQVYWVSPTNTVYSCVWLSMFFQVHTHVIFACFLIKTH